MSLLKHVLPAILIVFIYGCKNNQSKENTATKSETIIKTKKQPITDTAEKTVPKHKFVQLSDNNAMEFFLNYEKENKENKVRVTTDFGSFDILLYDQTKFHRANFIFLAKQSYFNGTQFHRVVPNFVIQGGNSDAMTIARRRQNIGRYLLPKDTRHGFTHDRGVISMPSSDVENPYQMASPYEFFIVVQKGGAHHLDGDYTVFGKVINGMDVVDKIAKQPTDDGQWPLHNIYIKKVEVLN